MRGLVFALVLALASCAGPDHGGSGSEGEWKVLFDGTSTAEWRGFKQPGFPAQGWEIDDGALRVRAKGGGGDIITVDTYEDFELELEWKVAPGANSGIIYGVSEVENATWKTGPEYQILDDRDLAPDAPTSAAGLYALYSPQDKALRPVGEYNHARVVVCGDRIEHWLNGRKVLAARRNTAEWQQRIEASKFAAMPYFGSVRRGHIALQDHGNDVWYRNIRIRELSVDRRDPRPRPLFNGRDLTGWTGFLPDGTATDRVWGVENGVLVCSGEPPGYLQTEEEFESFVLELEWRWSGEPGNSGVLLRVTGEDRVWPRCIEAQLQSGRAGDFWNIGEFPMVTDPERTKGRNTRHRRPNENPPGEWNRYTIVVDGETVVLKVNDVVLNIARECQVIPGRIALQSEGAPIQFRNIRITRLE